MSKLPKVAFICVHNSCRSQMAEALAKEYASDVFESYSAGTKLKAQINPEAITTIQEKYQIDMSKQYPKLLIDLPKVDVVITMGCNVSCPSLPCKMRMDWGLDDPTGQGKEAFIKTSELILQKVLALKAQLRNWPEISEN